MPADAPVKCLDADPRKPSIEAGERKPGVRAQQQVTRSEPRRPTRDRGTGLERCQPIVGADLDMSGFPGNAQRHIEPGPLWQVDPGIVYSPVADERQAQPGQRQRQPASIDQRPGAFVHGQKQFESDPGDPLDLVELTVGDAKVGALAETPMHRRGFKVFDRPVQLCPFGRIQTTQGYHFRRCRAGKMQIHRFAAARGPGGGVADDTHCFMVDPPIHCALQNVLCRIPSSTS